MQRMLHIRPCQLLDRDETEIETELRARRGGADD